MNYIVISILLSIVYASYILLTNYLFIINSKLNPRTIFVNVVILSSLLCLIFYPHELMAPEFTITYMLICLIGLCLFFQNYLLILGTKLPINFGIIDTLAICIYLPVVSVMLYVLFGEHISIRKIIGIIFACISGYFVLT